MISPTGFYPVLATHSPMLFVPSSALFPPGESSPPAYQKRLAIFPICPVHSTAYSYSKVRSAHHSETVQSDLGFLDSRFYPTIGNTTIFHGFIFRCQCLSASQRKVTNRSVTAFSNKQSIFNSYDARSGGEVGFASDLAFFRISARRERNGQE